MDDMSLWQLVGIAFGALYVFTGFYWFLLRVEKGHYDGRLLRMFLDMAILIGFWPYFHMLDTLGIIWRAVKRAAMFIPQLAVLALILASVMHRAALIRHAGLQPGGGIRIT